MKTEIQKIEQIEKVLKKNIEREGNFIDPVYCLGWIAGILED